MPTPQHRKLVDTFTGDWKSDERQQGESRTGRATLRPVLGGRFLQQDYRQFNGDHEVFQGHGLYGWDPAREVYTMTWFDTESFTPGDTLDGTWTDGVLRFERPGQVRYEYEPLDADSYVFRILLHRDGTWSSMFAGTFRRA